MRYQLHAKFISIGGSGSVIQDASGRDIFTVDSKILSLRKKLELKDMQGNILADIQKNWWSATTFKIAFSSGLSAEMSRDGGFLGPHRFKIIVTGQDELEARGNFLQRDYAIFRGAQQLARISKAWIAPGNTRGDPYGIETDDSQDQLLLLSCAVVIGEIYDYD